jgi:hypothetical protein
MARTQTTFSAPNSMSALNTMVDKLQRALLQKLLLSGALAIHGASSALAKIANTIYFTIDGTVYSKAAADCAALVGTVTNTKFNIFVFTVNSAGTFHTYMGTEGAALLNVVFPTIPDGEVVMGFVIINPTGTGNFVGGTTNLDDATVVPNAVYVNTPFAFHPVLLNPL